MVLVNESDDDKNPLFRLGLSKNEVITIFESNSINNYDITEITNDEESWDWGNTAINVLIHSSNFQFLFDKQTDKLYCINISGDKITDLSSTQSGLKLGDIFNQMVQLYGDVYSVYETEDGSSIYEYKIGNHYFYVEFLFGVVYCWGISEYRYSKA